MPDLKPMVGEFDKHECRDERTDDLNNEEVV
jgi:hypothetical protein